MPKNRSPQESPWLDRPFFSTIKLNWETGLFALILILAVVTRFYNLGDRVMSHDETTHVYFSWQLFRGQGYQHSPLSHGPLQFHLLALSYFIFSDNDFTARAPAALFSVLTIAFLWNYRRYLGRIGAIVAALLFLISPYMLYYGRYARNESWVALFGLMLLWGMLRYLDRGETKYLYVVTLATVLHFVAKETSFIYVAQALLFLGFLFLWRIGERKWAKQNTRRIFFITLLLSISLLVLAAGAQTLAGNNTQGGVSGTEVEEPVVVTEAQPSAPALVLSPVALVLGGVGLLSLAISLYLLVNGYGWGRLRQERSFDLMVLLFTLVLPHLSGFPIRWLGRDPLNYTDQGNLTFIAIVIAVLVVLSGVLGLLWNRRVWLINLAIFYAIFIPLYTTLFTNGAGFFSGLVGSLGYWLEQQGVERGNQPWYYYWAVQIPVYEFLATAGTLLAAWIGYRLWRKPRDKKEGKDTEGRNLKPAESRRLALSLFAFWALSALAAYTIAGEKMPWLTVHIALPMLLLNAWAFAWLIKRVDWARLTQPRSLLTVLLMVVFLFSLLRTLGILLGAKPPFAGQEQIQLQNTYRFIFFALLSAASAYGMLSLAEQGKWEKGQPSRIFLLLILAGLAFLTARAAFRASYINYDLATEYLVYAHMAPGPKEVMQQVEEISLRTTDGLDLQVAYDNETSYPFWWYLRNYPNQRFYADQPSRDLRQAPVIIVGDENYGKIEPVVGQAYYMFEYNRIWWPNQDYFDFTRSSLGFQFTSDTGLPAEDMSIFEYVKRVGVKLWSYLGDARLREGIYQIWMNRNFRPYLEARGQDPSLAQWNPSRKMRLYIRKDIAAQIWDYGVQPAPEAAVADPYEGKGVELAADLTIGATGTQPGQFTAPRGVAVAPDGSLYVADANNHRIQHLAADGTFIAAWGQFADQNSGDAPGGSFNEPWGVAVSPDGRFVYVADTWNHRIQKFSADGRFLDMWGVFGQDAGEFSMWGPRDLVVDNNGNLLVMDTGNKRIKVFDANGNFISQYGEFGFEPGQFDEPVGIAFDRNSNRIYVADTWNQRVQVFSYLNGNFEPIQSWDIAGWFGQSLVNKPYLTVGSDGRVYISDPEGGRVLVYAPDGTFVHFFGGYDQTVVEIGVAQGVAADAAGGLWLSDSQNNRLLHFILE